MTTISETQKINTEQIFTRNFFRRNWLIFGVALIGGLIYGSAPVVYGIMAGGLISIGSFFQLHRSLKSLFGTGSGASKFWMQMLSILKFAIIALVLLLLFVNFDINPVGLLIGLSTIVINVFYVAIKSLISGDLT